MTPTPNAETLIRYTPHKFTGQKLDYGNYMNPTGVLSFGGVSKPSRNRTETPLERVGAYPREFHRA